MNLIKPNKLKKGDTIAFVATSGFVKDEPAVFSAKKYFESRGFNVILADNVFDKNRYLAGEDDVKVKELHKMFLNPQVDAIIAIRGGYGAIRLIDKIDYEIIKENPKIFVGYSDISALSAMILKNTGLITYSGPMILSDFGANISEYTENAFFTCLEKNENLAFESDLTIYNPGTSVGITFGGNLTTIASLCGTDFIPNVDFNFFIEDLNEPVYKIDRMMTQLLNIKEFRAGFKGLIVGEFLDVDNSVWLKDFFKELGEELHIPVLGSFKITHGKDKLTIPYGAVSEIIGDKFIVNNKKD